MKRAALLGVASTVLLSSCALPPREAWRKIKDDGLIAYISYEIKTPRQGAPATPVPSTVTPVTPARSESPVMVYRKERGADEGRILTAQSVPALPGYVRSPYTNPPRLVDVRGVPPGTTMACPYTNRRFVVPAAGSVPTPRTIVADNPAPRKSSDSATSVPSVPMVRKDPPAVVLNNKPVEVPKTTPEKKSDIPSPPVVIPAPSAPLSQPAPSPAPAPAPSPSSKPAPAPVVASKSNATSPAPPVAPSITPAPSPAPAPAAAPKPVQEIPYGTAIPGRPGFVNSPYAAKHQLVDVTGLPSGMEVKCPYTGKLFRVPMKDVASGKPETVAPLSSPEPEKK